MCAHRPALRGFVYSPAFGFSPSAHAVLATWISLQRIIRIISMKAAGVEMSPGRATAPSALDLPPPFRLLALREVEDAFAQAQRLGGQEGAGTLGHAEPFAVAAFAGVLGPPGRPARGVVGGAGFAWPRGRPEMAPPAWLVFGARIRPSAFGEAEPGLRP